MVFKLCRFESFKVKDTEARPWTTSKGPEQSQHPRWNYKKAKWGLLSIRTNELTSNIKTEGKEHQSCGEGIQYLEL